MGMNSNNLVWDPINKKWVKEQMSGSGGAVGPAVTVSTDPDTNDECHTMAVSAVANTDALSGGTSTNSFAIGDTLRCFCDVDCYIRFDDAATAATSGSMYFAAGTELIRIPDGATHISVLRVSADGTLYITKVS